MKQEDGAVITREIWDNQLAFNSNFWTLAELENDPEEKRKWNSFYSLALLREVTEALDTTHWKMHRANITKVIPSNTLEELTDCMKYMMTLFQIHGFTPEDIQEEYFRKSAVVEQRYLQEMADSCYGKNNIVGVDIDGVLADYPRSYIEFMNQELGANFSCENVTNYDIGAHFGIPRNQAIQLKDKYRQTGQKRFIPVIEGAREFLQTLKDAGFTVVLLTARPYDEYKRMYADTVLWLKDNELPFDSLIFNEDKEAYLLKHFGTENVKFFVDDASGNANLISDAGVKCYLINRPYNAGHNINQNVIRTDNLEEVLNHENISN